MNCRGSILPSVLLVALLAVSGTGAEGALAADGPEAPEQAYFATLVAMHAIPNAPFLRLDYRFAQVASGIPDVTETRHAVERTDDGRVRFDEDGGEGRARSKRSPFFFIRPDLFLKPQVAVSSREFGIVTDTPYHVIGSTRTATHYIISDASAETVRDCPGGAHLQLRPKAGADPFYYNLRELWIAPASRRVCKAMAVWNAGNYMGHRFAVEFALDISSETGLIDRWSASGEARNGPFHARYRADAHYVNVKAEDSEPIGTFDH